MPNQRSDAESRPRYGRRLFIGAFVLLNVLVFGRLAWFWHLSEPSRQITVGPETTYLAGPLSSDGYVDYIAALNERQSAGVTTENNAVVLFAQAYGPQVVGDAIAARYYELLGIPVPAAGGKFMLDEAAFVRQSKPYQDSGAAVRALYEQHDSVLKRPWTRDEFPDFAAWLDTNAAPLATVTAGSRRERYYSPMISADPTPAMYSILLPVEQAHRAAARMLTTRAMLKLGEGDAAGAWEDLLTCHRLARLAGHSAFLVGALVSVAIDAIAFEADQSLLASPALTAEQARKCLEELQNLPPLPAMVDIVDHYERLGMLDAAILIARGEGNEFLDTGSPQSLKLTLSGAIEWDAALKLINEQFDALVAAMREPDAAERQKKLDELTQTVRSHDPQVQALALRSFLGARKNASRDMGWAVVHLLLSACVAAATAENRAIARERLLHAGFAVAAYQREHGTYPESLASLLPDQLTAVPLDPWSGKELLYLRTDAGFLAYSVGDNFVDNHGTDFDSAQRVGDIVLRVGAE